jgi:hypothetical protein
LRCLTKINNQLTVDHATPIEDERAEEPQTGPAQKGFEKESPAAHPAFAAQKEKRLVSIAQCLANARSTGAHFGARTRADRADIVGHTKCGVEVHRSDEYRWTDDEHRLPSDQSELHLGGGSGGRRVAKQQRGPNVARTLARPRHLKHRIARD